MFYLAILPSKTGFHLIETIFHPVKMSFDSIEKSVHFGLEVDKKPNNFVHLLFQEAHFFPIIDRFGNIPLSVLTSFCSSHYKVLLTVR
jgi:hypothetical protein